MDGHQFLKSAVYYRHGIDVCFRCIVNMSVVSGAIKNVPDAHECQKRRIHHVLTIKQTNDKGEQKSDSLWQCRGQR